MLRLFFPKVARLKDNVEKYGRSRQATRDNIMLRRKDPLCVPENKGNNTNSHTRNI
jgi:hypothetical protein